MSEKIDSLSDFGSDKIRIDTENLGLLFSTISEGLYSNPIGSVIREIVSNAYDATVEAKKNNPVIIHFDIDEGGYYVAIQDFGVGLSTDRIKNVFLSLFTSTKRNDDSQIGAFGIGRFSVFSYTNSYYVISVYGGKKTTYQLYKSDDLPDFMELKSEESDEENGTTIKFYLKDNTESSFHSFYSEYLNQLKFFPNVTLRVGGGIDINPQSNKIIKYKNFIGSSLHQLKMVNICLGFVSYPLSSEMIQILESTTGVYPGFNVALTFNNGELPVTRSREAIKYTDEAIVKITEKYKAFLDELTEMIKPEVYEVSSLRELYIKKGEDTKNLDLPFGLVDVSPLMKKKIKYHIKGHPYLNTDIFEYRGYSYDSVIGFHKSISFARGKRFTELENLTWNHLFSQVNLRMSSDYIKRKDKWLTSETISWSTSDDYDVQIGNKLPNQHYNYHTGISVIKKDERSKSLARYKQILYLTKYPKSEWRNMIKTFQKFVEEAVLDHTVRYEDLVVPATFDPRVGITFRSNNEKVNFTYYHSKDNYTNLEKRTEQICDIQKKVNLENGLPQKYPILAVSSKEDARIFKTIKPIIIGRTILKHLKKEPGIVMLDDIKNFDHKVLRKAVTSYYISVNLQKIGDRMFINIKYLNPRISNMYEELIEFTNKYNFSSNNDRSLEFWDDLLNFALEKKIILPHIVTSINYLNKISKNFDFLNYIHIDSFFSSGWDHLYSWAKYSKFPLDPSLKFGLRNSFKTVYQYYLDEISKQNHSDSISLVKEFLGRCGVDVNSCTYYYFINRPDQTFEHVKEDFKKNLSNFDFIFNPVVAEPIIEEVTEEKIEESENITQLTTN